jgi:hypothetical protein
VVRRVTERETSPSQPGRDSGRSARREAPGGERGRVKHAIAQTTAQPKGTVRHSLHVFLEVDTLGTKYVGRVHDLQKEVEAWLKNSGIVTPDAKLGPGNPFNIAQIKFYD